MPPPSRSVPPPPALFNGLCPTLHPHLRRHPVSQPPSHQSVLRHAAPHSIPTSTGTPHPTSRLLAADAAGQLDVLGHDSDALGVHGTQVRVLKEANVMRFGGLLEGKDGGSLEADLAEV